MTDDLNIDELLNGYIDGELDGRQQVELKRLVDHDPILAERLNKLKRCKMVVNALPRTQAPPHMLRDIKLKLERKTLIKEPHPYPPQAKTADAPHVFYRRLLKVAAMIALFAALTGVIYTIVAPSDSTRKTLVDKPWQPPVQVAKQTPEKTTEVTITEAIPLQGTFNGKIILTTQNLLPLDAFVNRGIVELGLLPKTELDSEKNR
ncbi:MAG: anti-sigma factor family protein, partial [Planctomycetota bacterium]